MDVTNGGEVIGLSDEMGPIPDHLQALIHQPPSVDPIAEEVEQVHTELTVSAEKVTEENPNSRFRVLDTATLKPGVCALCGSAGGDGRQFVDFGKIVDFFGAVYFCTFCVSEAAKLIGMAQESNWTLAKSELQREISKLDDLYVEAKAELNAARILLRNCTYGSGEPNSPGPDFVEADPEPEPDDSDSDESDGVKELGNIPEAPSDSDAVDESEPAKPRRRTSKSNE